MSEIRKVLIVEDQIFVAEDLADRLSAYKVLGPYDNGEEVVLQPELPDIALLDINLKGNMDGIQLAEWLNRQKATPIVFITKIADDSQTLGRIERLTFPYFYISKPITENELRTVVKNAFNSISSETVKPQDYASTQTKNQPQSEAAQPDKVLIRTALGLEALNIKSDIIYAESDGPNTRVRTVSGKELVVSSYLKVFLDRVDHLSDCMVRVSRFHAVNVTKITQIADSKHNLKKEKKIFLEGLEEPIRLNAQFRKELVKRFSSL